MATSSRKWNKERELKALEILRNLYPEELSALVHKDAPDLQISDFSIGVEVVQVMPLCQDDAKTLRIKKQNFKNKICEEDLSYLKEMEEEPFLLNGEVHGFVVDCDWSINSYERIFQTILNKCKKANESDKYSRFDDLRLFVFDECKHSSEVEFRNYFIDNIIDAVPYTRIYINSGLAFLEYDSLKKTFVKVIYG